MSYDKTTSVGTGTRTKSAEVIASSYYGLDRFQFSDVKRDANQQITESFAFEIDTTSNYQWFRYSTNSGGVSFATGFDRFGTAVNASNYSASSSLQIISATLNAHFGASFLDGEGTTLTGSIEHVVAAGSGEALILLKFESNPAGEVAAAGAKFLSANNEFRVAAAYTDPVSGNSYLLISTSWALAAQTTGWLGQTVLNGSTGATIDSNGNLTVQTQSSFDWTYGRGTTYWIGLELDSSLSDDNRDIFDNFTGWLRTKIQY